jgi:hypothetical protein
MEEGRYFPSQRRMIVVFDKRFPGLYEGLNFGDKGFMKVDLIVEGLKLEMDENGNELIEGEVLIKNASLIKNKEII